MTSSHSDQLTQASATPFHSRYRRCSGLLLALGLAWLSPTAFGQSSPYTFSTFAGIATKPGSTDGTGGGSQLPLFNRPIGVVVNSSGNVYVTDSGNELIRIVTPAGVVTTLAGTPGTNGGANGTGVDTGVTFNSPQGPAVDSAGNLYVADYLGATIRKITPAGVVTTIAGTASATGSADGSGAAARFLNPSSVAVDSAGNLYVADSGNNTIRKITSAGVVTTFAGTVGSAGITDGVGTAARFNKPRAVVIDSSGNLFVADYNNNCIRKITSSGTVTTFAGNSAAFGSADGVGTAATFSLPAGLTIDPSGNLYVADTSNNTIRKITSAGAVTTLAGSASAGAGKVDGAGSAARFNLPTGLTLDNSGNLYVADLGNELIRKVTPAGVVTTVAGAGGTSGTLDGSGFILNPALFSGPSSAATDSSGNVYVADTTTHVIRKVTPAGVVTTLAGTARSSGTTDGNGSAARFSSPGGVALDGSGNVYVADTGNHTIRKITAAGDVSTLAGIAGTAGSANGAGTAATFNLPSKLAVDGSGNVYVADYANHTIRKITAAGVVTTFAGTAGTAGHLDGTGGAATFDFPRDVALDGSGNVYVADSGNHAIRKITAGGAVSTFAGTAGSNGTADGTGSAARFDGPAGLTVSASGMVIVADANNSTIRQITSSGVVSTVGGTAGSAGNLDGVSTAARFNHPSSVALDIAGNLYVADTRNQTIRKGTTPDSITASASLGLGSGSSGSGSGGSGSGGSGSGSGGSSGSTGGVGSATGNTIGAGFVLRPRGITFDSTGTMYIADTANNCIKKVASDGTVTVFAGKEGSAGSTDGTGDAARFNGPTGIAVDGLLTVYVCDTGNATIRKITQAGVVTTFVGSAGNRGTADGTGTAALFSSPTGLVLDSAVNLYVTDSGSNTIRLITQTGVVTTFAGTAKKTGDADGVGPAALFNNPTGIAIDASANLYVADTFNQTIRKISTAALSVFDKDGTTVLRTIPAGTSTTLAGSAGISGIFDGTGMFALFNSPNDVSLDASNNVYVADSGNSCIRRITPAGVVTTIAGIAGISGNRDGAGSSALFNQPQALKYSSFIYVLDTGNSIVRAIFPSNFAVSTVPLKAATTTTTTTPSTSSSGGGGAPSGWFLAGLGLLAAGRRLFRRRGIAD